MKSKWYEMLQHPKWQKKRLEILEREDFTCEICGSTDKQLHIHHNYYEPKLKPWEYDSDTLHCLCCDCHLEEKNKKLLLDKTIGEMSHGMLDELLGYAKALIVYDIPIAAIHINSAEEAVGVSDYWRIKDDDIISNIKNGSITIEKLIELQEKKYGKKIHR